MKASKASRRLQIRRRRSSSARTGDYQPGFLSPFTFSSGLKLIAPFPNDNDDNGETLVGEYDTLLDPRWGLDDNGRISSPSDLPHGTAFIGANKEADGTLTFGFPKDVYIVDAFVDAVRDNETGSRGLITATAYDASGDVITASRILSVPKADWSSNLITLRSDVPIAKVVFTGNFLVLDALTFNDAKPKIVKGSNGNDRIGSTSSKDTSDGSELIQARKGNDKVFARDGDDTLFGGSGKDKLHGGNGNDTLIGDEGKDKLWGDAGQDSFLFKTPGPPDTVRDFNIAEDSILLDGKAFSGLNPGQLLDVMFGNGIAPIDADDRIMYNRANGDLIYDADAGGAGKAVVFAKLAPGLDLTAEHFFVV